MNHDLLLWLILHWLLWLYLRHLPVAVGAVGVPGQAVLVRELGPWVVSHHRHQVVVVDRVRRVEVVGQGGRQLLLEPPGVGEPPGRAPLLLGRVEIVGADLEAGAALGKVLSIIYTHSSEIEVPVPCA